MIYCTIKTDTIENLVCQARKIADKFNSCVRFERHKIPVFVSPGDNIEAIIELYQSILILKY